MGKKLGKVFNVSRIPKTAKAVNIGDFETLEQAEKAMMEHFNSTPKRGEFYYTIREDELKDIGGTIMRMFSITLSGGAGSYYKKYFPAELKEMGGC